jgi:hypothetical protein
MFWSLMGLLAATAAAARAAEDTLSKKCRFVALSSAAEGQQRVCVMTGICLYMGSCTASMPR